MKPDKFMDYDYIRDYQNNLNKTEDFKKSMGESATCFSPISEKYKVSQTYGHNIKDLYTLGLEDEEMQYIIPGYQRGLVWDDAQKEALILSIGKGLPIGDFLITVNKWTNFFVIDGQQRINTIREFIMNKFSVKIDGKSYFWDDLSFKDRYNFLCYKTVTNVLLNVDEEEQAKIYLAINSYGTAHTAEEVNKAKKYATM